VKLLVVTAVEAEGEAVLRDTRDADVTVVGGGVGPVAAATMTCRALAANEEYTHVISAGICGAFADRAAIGDVVVATSSITADLGCRTDDGFLTLADMGLQQQCEVEFPDAEAWSNRLADAGVRVRSGAMLTLSCMTGTDAEAEQLALRHPSAVGEAMEGWGVAWAARSFGVRMGEVRAVSNLVGKRDPSTWDVTGAFDALSRAFGVLLAEPLP
jgi:futalosine hydrolase